MFHGTSQPESKGDGPSLTLATPPPNAVPLSARSQQTPSSTAPRMAPEESKRKTTSAGSTSSRRARRHRSRSRRSARRWRSSCAPRTATSRSTSISSPVTTPSASSRSCTRSSRATTGTRRPSDRASFSAYGIRATWALHSTLCRTCDEYTLACRRALRGNTFGRRATGSACASPRCRRRMGRRSGLSAGRLARICVRPFQVPHVTTTDSLRVVQSSGRSTRAHR